MVCFIMTSLLFSRPVGDVRNRKLIKKERVQTSFIFTARKRGNSGAKSENLKKLQLN